MRVWVVRHACAGHKKEWKGSDDERPLDPVGVEQAQALASVLGTEPTFLWSSPMKRCVDTLAAISAATGLAVQTDTNLRPPGGDGLLARIESPDADGHVLCTHGEVMQPALTALRGRGVLTNDRTDDELLLKGAAWRLDKQTDSQWELTLCAPMPRVSCPHHAERD